MEWSDNFTKTWDTFNDVVVPKRAEQREKALEDYTKASSSAYRKFIIAMIKDWYIDPFSLDEPVPHDLVGDLLLLGISAAAAVVLIKTLGAAKISTLVRTSTGLKKLKNWWNKGRNKRVPDEDTASWKDLKADDMSQGSKFIKKGSRGKNPKDLTDADFEGGAIPTNLDCALPAVAIFLENPPPYQSAQTDMVNG